ncbi:unnamed protein product [Umbelopsis sp. WA50703]
MYGRRDVQKLVIGTQVSNPLVTPSMLLDEKHDPSVGGTTVHFKVDSISDQLACRIFIDEESLKAGLAMVDDKSATKASATGMLPHQLRQLRMDHHGRIPSVKVFGLLATQIIQQSTSAVLGKDGVASILQQATGNSKETMMSILDLFGIKSLNARPEELAEVLIPSFAANELLLDK